MVEGKWYEGEKSKAGQGWGGPGKLKGCRVVQF